MASWRHGVGRDLWPGEDTTGRRQRKLDISALHRRHSASHCPTVLKPTTSSCCHGMHVRQPCSHLNTYGRHGSFTPSSQPTRTGSDSPTRPRQPTESVCGYWGQRSSDLSLVLSDIFNFPIHAFIFCLCFYN